MIRDATHQDIPVMLKMGVQFYDTTYLGCMGGFDEKSAAITFANLIQSHICAVEDQGKAMAAMTVVSNPYNHAHKFASECFWWVAPEMRGTGIGGELLGFLEDRAKERGCSMVVMTSLMTSPEHARAFYERNGYELREMNYAKVM